MFIGEYTHSIDSKNRLIIPSKFRDLLGDEFVITKGLEGNLIVFEKYEFEKFQDNLNQKPEFDRGVRKLKRLFLAGAQCIEPDKQGRMVVPPPLREYAGLEKDVVFAGVGSHIEVWDKSKWEAVASFDDIEEIAEDLAGMGVSF